MAKHSAVVYESDFGSLWDDFGSQCGHMSVTVGHLESISINVGVVFVSLWGHNLHLGITMNM